jgi:protein-L-isoaspartate(D-aspartate) O-methyltransferase
MLKCTSLHYFTGCCNLEKTDWEKLIDNLIKQNILRSPKVIQVMRAVPRTKFLPRDMQAYNAADTPLPIGFGQTISAPHSLQLDAELGETWFQ